MTQNILAKMSGVDQRTRLVGSFLRVDTRSNPKCMEVTSALG